MEINMKANMMGKSGAVLATLVLLTLSACTKSIPYKELPPEQKEHTVSKSLIDTNAEYLYSASMQNASRSSVDAMPYAAGDNKRVKLEIDEFSLRVIETERDARFASNNANHKLVLEIPIQHTEFRCAKDRFGECTNTEENDTQVPWKQRSGIKVKLVDAKSGELDILPIMVSQTIGENCYSPVSSRLISSKIEPDAINFQIERTFKTNIDCLGQIDGLSDGIVTAIFHYSFVKVDSILSKDFKTVSYPEGSADELNFGFFSSQRMTLDVDNTRTEKGLVQIMNHWNPNRREIVYHLSDEFAKPQNKILKDLTFQTVDNLNKSLKIAGAKFQITLKEPSGKSPGDIRNSMIILVEDPIESGAIGYGPQTEDPVTGEIVSARTVMFSGNIIQGIPHTYNEILREKRAERDREKSALAQKATPALTLSSQLQLLGQIRKASSKSAQAVETLKQIEKKVNESSIQSKPVATTERSRLGIANNMDRAARIKTAIRNYKTVKNPEIVGTDLKAQFKYIHTAKNCALTPTGDVSVHGISPKLMAQFSADDKPWAELSAREKQRVVDIILPEVWVPTLIHEIGHNLGLRHNFQGSEDKANFYTPEELAALQISRPVPFSSVMDYGNDLKALPVLGKYDIAALRFAYAREVEIQKPEGVEIKKIETTLEDLLKSLKLDQANATLKEYGYCTDEHRGINAGCRVWDEGTSYTEIVKNMIKMYEDNYELRNFRNGAANFSLVNDFGYYRARNNFFHGLRVMMEVRERIKYRFNLSDDAKEFTEIEFLKDLNEASLLAGAYMAQVLLIPDLTCAAAQTSAPNEIVELVPLKDIDPEAMSCFDLQLNPPWIIVAQAGKSFNSKKSPDSTNSYVDQIDLRGIWGDKLAVMNQLFQRQTGVYTFDKDYQDNFVNISPLRDPIQQVVNSIMLNKVVAPVVFTLKDGSKATFEVPYDMYTTQIVDQPLIASLGRRMGLNENAPTELQGLLATRFVHGMYDKSGAHEQDRPLGMALSLKRYDANQVLRPDVTSFVYGTTRFVAEPGNILARQALTGMEINQKLEKLSRQQLLSVMQAKMTGAAAPVDATDEIKAAWDIPLETIQSALLGDLNPTEYYTRLLQILPETID